MNQPPSNSETPKQLSTNELASDRTELAKYRSRAAADRTLMAWIRTSLSLIGFGFGIPTLVNTIEKTQKIHHVDPVRFSVIVGLAFIGTGMLGMALGLKEHRRLLQQIQRDRYTYESSHSAEIVGVALLVIGFISFIGVIIKSLNF
ncbi:MAG: YidH family protein [Microcystaceae cyanobacterium]